MCHKIKPNQTKSEKQQKIESRNGKKHNCTDIWSNRQERLHAKKLRKRNLKRETQSLLRAAKYKDQLF